MTKEKFPTTPAVLALKAQDADYTLHSYPYEKKGGTKRASSTLMVDEHRIIKTLIMEEETGRPFIILMHGDKEVSTKSLARAIGTKSVARVSRWSLKNIRLIKSAAHRLSAPEKICPSTWNRPSPTCRKFYINAGSRGLLARMPSSDLIRITEFYFFFFFFFSFFIFISIFCFLRSALLYKLPFFGKKVIMFNNEAVPKP